MKDFTYKNSLITSGSILTFVLSWQFASSLVGKEIILPSPLLAYQTLVSLIGSKGFWLHLSATLLRGMVGFSLSYLVGLVIGLFSGLNQNFKAFFQPWLAVIRSTPSMALIVLSLIWFQSNSVTLFVTFLVVFPIIAQNVAEGIHQVDPNLKEMARLYQVRSSRVLREMYLPAILPYLAAGGAAGLGLTWKVMIAAEVFANPKMGIGTQMDTARVFLQTPEVFAWTIVVVTIGLCFDQLLNLIIRKQFLFWE